MIGAAIWIALGAFDSGSEDTVTVAETPTTQVAATATQVPQTQPLEVEDPTPIPEPTALDIPTPEATAVPPTAVPTEVPEATAVPAPAPTAVPATNSGSGSGNSGSGGSGSGGSAPAATNTPVPDNVTIRCTTEGAKPTEAEVGEAVGPFTAATTPAEAASGITFTWDFGNATGAVGSVTPAVSYASTGTYRIGLTGVDASGNAYSGNCATIKVGETAAAVKVSCSVKPADTDLKWEDALPGDELILTVSWTPADTPIRLQVDLGPGEDLIWYSDVTSPWGLSHTFTKFGADFGVYYRYLDQEENLLCPAFKPGSAGAVPAPTADPTLLTATPTPAATSTPTATATATPTS